MEAVILALIIAVAVGLISIFVGRVLATLGAPVAVTIGGYLEQWGWVIGVLAGLWWYFAGGTIFGVHR